MLPSLLIVTGSSSSQWLSQITKREHDSLNRFLLPMMKFWFCHLKVVHLMFLFPLGHCFSSQKWSLNWLISFYFQAIPKYLEKCKFLPKLNNELPQARNLTYKERFSSLQNLVLIMVGLKGFTFMSMASWTSISYSYLKNQQIKSSYSHPINFCLSSLSMTLFWSPRKRPGLVTTQMGL